MNRLISVAPMMDCTDRHERYFLRLIAPSVLLYTEMVTANALIHGDVQRHLAFDPLEHPVALQLGGHEPKKLAHCAKLGAEYGYDEINLNVGCPSDRVKSGQFGACLMLNPGLVADCVAAMRAVTSLPVTVKCRIGVDERDSYEHLQDFIATVASAGCTVFIIHARKAWLQGLSPKQNRTLPPLHYETVYQLKRDFPALTIVINGGIRSVHEIEAHLRFVDGVMVGREAYANPYFLAEMERQCFNTSLYDLPTRYAIIEKLIPYVEQQLANNVRLTAITRHILGLFQGQAGARAWRRYLSAQAYKTNSGSDVLREALSYVRDKQC